ncbi:MAG: hypothetical protein R3F02_12390 [Thiolinea sp.]
MASYRNLEANIERIHDKEWSDRLGTAEELEEAQVIISNSLKVASDAIDASELREAKAQGMLTQDDLKVIARLERETEMQIIRDDRLSNNQQLRQKNNLFRH